MSNGRTRRRGEALEQALLDAAWAELAEHGWDGFSIGGVAARCGTAKTVLYRRWDNRVDVARAMLMRALRTDGGEVSTSGDLRTDLVAFLRGMEEFLSGPFGEAARGVITEGTDRRSSLVDAEVPMPLAAIVDAAVARGELTATPSSFAQNLGHAVMMSELLHSARPLGSPAIEELVDGAWLPALRHRTTHPSG